MGKGKYGHRLPSSLLWSLSSLAVGFRFRFVLWLVADLGPLVLNARAAKDWPTPDEGGINALCDPSEVFGSKMKLG